MHFTGLAGMPRRIVDYSLQFADFNMVSSIGSGLLGLTQVLFLYIVIKTIRGGEKATTQVWEGADGLEWTVPSPAPLHTFETPPQFPIAHESTTDRGDNQATPVVNE
jgi:cytochrome c oxidase subunit 1